MKIHIVSETEFVVKGQGVHTAHVDLLELLREKKEVDVVVNNEGTGDVFHSHTYGPYYFWKGRKYKGKRIHTVHVIPDSIKGSIPFWKLMMPITKWYFKKVYSYADVCIALSPMVENAIKELGVKSKIKLIGNPLPFERWVYTDEKRRRGRTTLKAKETDFIVLGVGQLIDRKGVLDFIEIAEKFPHIKFIWIGGRPFGAFTDGIKKINDRIANTSANVQFIGLVDLMEMPDLYAAGDLFLFPSYQENCPLAPLEAAAAGLPVIYRDLKEYELLYENTYLKAKNNLEFASLIKQMKEDKHFYETGKNISETLIKQFDKNEIYKKIMSVYQELNN
jgi:1,2-diacylglycerol-3-alpha-glucose alpha-1,2-galactosyltransferase